MNGIKFILCLFLFSCYNNIKKNHDLSINTGLLSKYSDQSDKTIILSCISCSCFKPILTNLSDVDKLTLSKYRILGDTNCFKTKLPITQIRQNTIDSLSDDIYNITLVRKVGEKYNLRIIETNESSKLVAICRDFFEK